MSAPRRWLRLDMDFADSEWLIQLDGYAAALWPQVLCWVKAKGVDGRCRRPSVTALSIRWRVRPDTITELLNAAVEDGAMEVTKEEWVVTNWQKYQIVDPTAAERMRQYRARKAEADGTIVPIRKDAK